MRRTRVALSFCTFLLGVQLICSIDSWGLQQAAREEEESSCTHCHQMQCLLPDKHGPALLPFDFQRLPFDASGGMYFQHEPAEMGKFLSFLAVAKPFLSPKSSHRLLQFDSFPIQHLNLRQCEYDH